MKKNIFFAMLLALAAPVLTSCSDKDSEDKSRITYYAVLELNGDANMTTPVGAPFTDPGCKATMGGEDVSDLIQVTGSVNSNVVGFYPLGYTVVNADGFPASTSRMVAVVDPNNFASAYYGESQYGSRHYYNAPIGIHDNGDGTYTIDDILGGFYCYGRYPSYLGVLDFFLDAVIKLNADNSIDLVSYGNWYWGDDVPTFLDGNYDPATGVVSLNMDFGAPFTVRLTQ
jgi:hypothetical protein